MMNPAMIALDHSVINFFVVIFSQIVYMVKLKN